MAHFPCILGLLVTLSPFILAFWGPSHLSFGPFGGSFPFILAFWGRLFPFILGLLGARTPFILAFWGIIFFYFAFLGVHEDTP